MTTDEIVTFTAALWAVISAFIALTPSTKDDAALTGLRAFLERLSFLQPKTSPGALSMPGWPAAKPVDNATPGRQP